MLDINFIRENPNKVKEIIEEYGYEDGINISDKDRFYQLFKNKRYCILIFLKNPEKIKTFNINKKGFGIMSAWITVENINKIKC